MQIKNERWTFVLAIIIPWFGHCRQLCLGLLSKMILIHESHAFELQIGTNIYDPRLAVLLCLLK